MIRCAYCQLPILPGQSYRMLAVDGPWPDVYRNIYVCPKCDEQHGIPPAVEEEM